MISRELIERINYLWHKQQTVGLTPEEKEMQKAAREEYLAAIKAQVRGMLEELKGGSRAEGSRHQNGHGSGCSCCSHSGHRGHDH